MTKRLRTELGLPALLLLLGGVAVLSALARLVWMHEHLTHGIHPPTGEAPYVEQPGLALLHLLPGIAFMILGPLQFMPRMRRRWPRVHRVSGRVFVLCGYCTGITGLVMAAAWPGMGSVLVSAFFVVVGVVQCAALTLGMAAILRRELPAHRAWMMRAYGVGLSVASMRVALALMTLAFDLEPTEALVVPTVFSTLLVHVVLVELVLARGRKASQTGPRSEADRSPASA